jgi:DNA-binding transcriptional MerR regulator
MAEYTINELADISGTARRNIHFYVQQGLLPPPEGAGLAARYGDEHLLRLRAIPVLRSRGLRLDEIRAQMANMQSAEIERLIAHPQPVPPIKEIPPPRPPWPRAETVTRYVLAPGVELLVAAGAVMRQTGAIEELVRSAQRLFDRTMKTQANGGKE